MCQNELNLGLEPGNKPSHASVSIHHGTVLVLVDQSVVHAVSEFPSDVQ